MSILCWPSRCSNTTTAGPRRDRPCSPTSAPTAANSSSSGDTPVTAYAMPRMLPYPAPRLLSLFLRLPTIRPLRCHVPSHRPNCMALPSILGAATTAPPYPEESDAHPTDGTGDARAHEWKGGAHRFPSRLLAVPPSGSVCWMVVIASPLVRQRLRASRGPSARCVACSVTHASGITSGSITGLPAPLTIGSGSSVSGGRPTPTA